MKIVLKNHFLISGMYSKECIWTKRIERFKGSGFKGSGFKGSWLRGSGFNGSGSAPPLGASAQSNRKRN
jgi:hypothetical protein